MGTPDFAVPSLQILVDNGYDVVAVITAPDKPAGRGQQLQMSAVKKYALEKGLNILQPTNLKDENFLKELTKTKKELEQVKGVNDTLLAKKVPVEKQPKQSKTKSTGNKSPIGGR